MEQLVDLAAFRRQNLLSQEALAKLLGTSRGYIGMVESGKSKLSDEKIEKLLQLSTECDLDIAPLFPAVFRISTIEAYYQCAEITVHPYVPSEDSDIQAPISYSEWKDLSHGKIGISEILADKLVACYPVFNKEWLLTGNGPMLAPEPAKDDKESTLVSLLKRIDDLEKKLDYIISRLDK